MILTKLRGLSWDEMSRHMAISSLLPGSHLHIPIDYTLLNLTRPIHLRDRCSFPSITLLGIPSYHGFGEDTFRKIIIPPGFLSQKRQTVHQAFGHRVTEGTGLIRFTLPPDIGEALEEDKRWVGNSTLLAPARDFLVWHSTVPSQRQGDLDPPLIPLPNIIYTLEPLADPNNTPNSHLGLRPESKRTGWTQTILTKGTPSPRAWTINPSGKNPEQTLQLFTHKPANSNA